MNKEVRKRAVSHYLGGMVGAAAAILSEIEETGDKGLYKEINSAKNADWRNVKEIEMLSARIESYAPDGL